MFDAVKYIHYYLDLKNRCVWNLEKAMEEIDGIPHAGNSDSSDCFDNVRKFWSKFCNRHEALFDV